MDRTYIDSQSSCFYNDMLKKCMGKGHKTPKYLFNPRITEEWKKGGTLVAENGGYPPTQNGDIRSLFWLFSLMALQN